MLVGVYTREMYSRESMRSVPRYGIGSRLPVVCLRCFDPRKLYFHGTSGKQRTRRQLVRKCPTSPLLLTEWELLPNRTHSHLAALCGGFVCARAAILNTSEIFIHGPSTWRVSQTWDLICGFFDQFSIKFSLPER